MLKNLIPKNSDVKCHIDIWNIANVTPLCFVNCEKNRKCKERNTFSWHSLWTCVTMVYF